MSTGGWVHSVSFSADGNRLAWVGHDSSINIYDAANSQQSVELYSHLTSYFLAFGYLTFVDSYVGNLKRSSSFFDSIHIFVVYSLMSCAMNNMIDV